MAKDKTTGIDYLPIRARMVMQMTTGEPARTAFAGVMLADLVHADTELWEADIIIMPRRRLDASEIRGGGRLDQALTSHWFSNPEEYDLEEVDPQKAEQREKAFREEWNLEEDKK